MRPVPTAAIACSAASLLGATVASLVTIGWDGAFPSTDGEFNLVLAEARGWSAVTLGLGVPLGAATLRGAIGGSLRSRLAWAGVMVYLTYTYLEFAVSPPFSALYLVYIVTFATAIPAALIAVWTVDIDDLPAAFGDRAPRLAVAAFSFLFAAGLSLAWSRGIVTRLIAGDFGYPTGADAVGHVVHALDLGLVVPLGVATGWLLLARRPEGYLLGGITLVFALIMSAALVAMVGLASVLGGQSGWVAAPFMSVTLVAWLIGIPYFRAVERPISQ